jgi:hypothetical protein
MMRSVMVLAVDWERLRDAYPDRTDKWLAADAVRRGLRLVQGPVADAGPSGPTADRRLAWLQASFPRRSGSICTQRFDLVTGRERFRRAAEMERRTYDEHLELERDLVPPLKERAKTLRAELRALEEQLRQLGVDPEGIEPKIDWPRTLAVDTYTRPHYEPNESRRRRTVEFFRRTTRG